MTITKPRDWRATPAGRDLPNALEVIDSHTAGEPTRTVVSGLPELGVGSVADSVAAQRDRLREMHDWVRTSLIAEPRGSNVMVGAALVPSSRSDCTAGVIFFNNIGYLGMCGHGTIGVVATMAHIGMISAGRYRLETPVGVIQTTLGEDGRVSVENVPSYRVRQAVEVTLDDGRIVRGDIAWGGNWFYLCPVEEGQIRLDNVDALTELATRIRRALETAGIRGAGEQVIDHIELYSDPPPGAPCDLINFVLCPGMAYDRSPCGTGTSAKVACLAADGRLAVGQRLRVGGISGEMFEARYSWDESQEAPAGRVIPVVTGRAYITAQVRVVFDPEDPFRFGIR